MATEMSGKGARRRPTGTFTLLQDRILDPVIGSIGVVYGDIGTSPLYAPASPRARLPRAA
jgi:hypothetical protein